MPALQAQARLRSDIKATKTIAITVGAYFACYVPVILYAVVGEHDGSQPDSWFSFLTWYALFFSTAVNPIIYYQRNNRYRSAFKQFLKDPFGSNDFKDKPNGRGKGRDKPKPERLAADGGAGGDNANKFQVNGSQARPNDHDEERNEVHLCETGKRSDGVRAKQQRGEALGSNSGTFSGPVSASSFPLPRVVMECTEACASKNEVQKPSEGEDEEIEEESVKEQLQKSGLEDDSRKGKGLFTVKVHPMECRAQKEREVVTHCPEETKRKEIHGKQQHAITPVYLPHHARSERSEKIENSGESAVEAVVIDCEFHEVEEMCDKTHTKKKNDIEDVRAKIF